MTTDTNVISLPTMPAKPTNVRVISLSGWKGSGKDTVADYLTKYYGFIKLSLATLLKDTVSTMYNIPRPWFDDHAKKEVPLMEYPLIPSDPFVVTIHSLLSKELESGYWTPRALCILEGSIKRSVSSGYWLSKVLEVIRSRPGTKFVISDMRYQSEADSLRILLPKNELLLWRINRWESIDTTDPSERDLDNYSFDITLGNPGITIQGLYDTVDWIMLNLGKSRRV